MLLKLVFTADATAPDDLRKVNLLALPAKLAAWKIPVREPLTSRRVENVLAPTELEPSNCSILPESPLFWDPI